MDKKQLGPEAIIGRYCRSRAARAAASRPAPAGNFGAVERAGAALEDMAAREADPPPKNATHTSRLIWLAMSLAGVALLLHLR